MNEAIKISRLTKSYGTHTVLKGLDFCVRQGEIFALLGINGAAKTTSFECIEGLRMILSIMCYRIRLKFFEHLGRCFPSQGTHGEMIVFSRVIPF